MEGVSFFFGENHSGQSRYMCSHHHNISTRLESEVVFSLLLPHHDPHKFI